MINNRLFKKINAIFWGLLTWLPIVILILSLFKTSDIQFSPDYTPYNYIYDSIFGFSEVFASFGDGIIYNPLTDLLITSITLFLRIYLGALYLGFYQMFVLGCVGFK